MTPEPPTIPLLLIAGAFVTVQILVAVRATQQDMRRPETRHVLPVGFCSLVAAVGFGAWPLAPSVGPWVAAAGMIGVAIVLIGATPVLLDRPSLTDLGRLRGEIEALDRRMHMLGRAVGEVAEPRRRRSDELRE